MAAYDRVLADFYGIVETLLSCMAKVNHHSLSVHLFYYLCTKRTYTIMCVAPFGRVADVIVSVVAQGDIDNSALREVLDVLDVMLQSQSVLNPEHDALSSFALIFVKVGGSTGDTEVSAVLFDNVLYLVKDQIGISHRTIYIKWHF